MQEVAARNSVAQRFSITEQSQHPNSGNGPVAKQHKLIVHYRREEVNAIVAENRPCGSRGNQWPETFTAGRVLRSTTRPVIVTVGSVVIDGTESSMI